MTIWIYTTKEIQEYRDLEENSEIKRSSTNKAKKGDIILIYRGKPYSNISYIFKAKTDAYEDKNFRDDWDIAIDLNEKIEIPNPLEIQEMRDDPILGNWNIVRKNFIGSFFKVPPKEWERFKALILEKNPELENDIENLENEKKAELMKDTGTISAGYYDLNAGRAHIVRDICYLISKNDNISENNLFEILKENVKDDLYWRAYYQRSTKNNSPGYNLRSARTLKLIFKNKLELTDLGNELVNAVTPEELFTYNYGIGVKKFFYKLALQTYPIRTAMNILKEKEKLRFYASLCGRANKVAWKYKETEDGFICEETKHSECNNCDRDLLKHIKESSLPFETLKETKVEEEGFVFWMCSRVTPMYLTGSEPGYSGNYIYWNEKAEKELETGNSNVDPDIIKMLYKEFENNFYKSEEGISHYQKYDLEHQKVKKYFEMIGNDPEAKFNTQDPPINHLLPIKEPAVAPVAVGTIKVYGYEDKDLPGLTEAVYNLIQNLIETDDKSQQKELITTFKSGPYKKGFGTGTLTPVLHYLNPEFFFINRRAVSFFRFISKLLGKDDNISVELVEYIDNNEKLKKLFKTLTTYIPDLNFEKFDEFCHWLCSKDLGNYAEDQEKFKAWMLKNYPSDKEVVNENEFLKFLKGIYSHEMQVALGELGRGKNVILYGPPGSGKTVLSKIVSEEYLGKNAYSLYTVHSGTDYYDLVCRIVPQINGNGDLVYSKERRFLLDALLSGKVLILDEINRTQIDTALGIFFTYLERDHRISDAEQIKEILKKEIDEELEINDLSNKLADFRIIGTLNVYDKTFLFKLGDALKRRFTFIEITTEKDLIEKLTSFDEFKKEFIDACDYKGDFNTVNTIIDVFANLNSIKPLGIGILKDSLQFSSYFSENAADLSVSSLIVPFFENDLNYSNILGILEKYDLNVSINKLKSLNFGTSDINGI